MTKDKTKDFWRDFIKAWKHLDDMGITDVVTSGFIRERDFETGRLLTIPGVFSKHAVDNEAIRYLGEFRRTFTERLAVTPYNELEAYQREYNAYNSDFVETRKANMSITLLIDDELLSNGRTKIKCIIRNGEIKNIDFSFDDYYSRMNCIKKFMFPLDKLCVLDNSNGYYQIDYAQLLDAKKGEHINEIYFETWTYPLLSYVIGKAYYCKFLFNRIEQLKQPQQSTEPNPTKTKILFLTANPRDEEPLRLESELRKVLDTLDGATFKNNFDYKIEPAVRIDTITKAMQTQQPEIVHFSGHGSIEGLAVENDSGNSNLFPTESLDRLFRLFKETTKCVIFNACDSKELAKTISKHGIHVIGMNDEIGDEAARKFSIGFYQSLGEGKDYKFAFDIGMIQISENIPELWFNGERIKN